MRYINILKLFQIMFSLKPQDYKREAGPLPSTRALRLAEVVASFPAPSPEVSCFRAAEDLITGEFSGQ